MNMFKIFDSEFHTLIYQKKEEKEEQREKIYDQDNCFCISCLFFIENMFLSTYSTGNTRTKF